MPFDTHNHTDFSFDSEMGIEEALKAAEDSRLNLILTEHLDLNEKQDDGSPVDFPIGRYFEKYRPYRGRRLLLGIELGLDNRPAFNIQNRRIADEYPFDYVIGSVHNIQNFDICTDQDKNFMMKTDFFNHYLIYAENVVNRNPYIDAFAHIDYPCRYLDYGDNVLRYEEFPILLDNFLSALIHHDICLEINLRLLDQKEFYDGLTSILRRYRELGGSYVTIGGDNHTPDTIGAKFQLGVDLARHTDLIPVYFKNRSRIIDDL